MPEVLSGSGRVTSVVLHAPARFPDNFQILMFCWGAPGLTLAPADIVTQFLVLVTDMKDSYVFSFLHNNTYDYTIIATNVLRHISH